MQAKSCTNPNCEQVNPQPVSEFYLSKGKKDGYNSHCKSCWRRYLEANREKRRQKQAEYNRSHREYTKEYYEANKERVLKRMVNYRENNPHKTKEHYEANKDRLREVSRNYGNANSEKRKEALRNWRKKNTERIRDYARRYIKENPGISVVTAQNRRVRKAENGGSFTLEEWRTLCNCYDNKCLACGERKKLEADHVVPISKGG